MLMGWLCWVRHFNLDKIKNRASRESYTYLTGKGYRYLLFHEMSTGFLKCVIIVAHKNPIKYFLQA